MKRKQKDITRLQMSDYGVEMSPKDSSRMVVKFHGPKDSLYEGGIWRVNVALPADYPYASPSIGFLDRIYHPNIDLQYLTFIHCVHRYDSSGTVCLDVIN